MVEEGDTIVVLSRIEGDLGYQSPVAAGGRVARPAGGTCRCALPRVLLGLLAQSTLAERVFTVALRRRSPFLRA
jgi:hypothetical protein